MKARGKLAIFAGIAALLIVSTSFSERRNIKTWAPNAVIAEPKPTETRITLTARPDPAPIVLNSDLEKAAPAPEQRASGRAEPAGAARASMAMIDPEATAALPTQTGPELSAAPRLSNKWRAAGTASAPRVGSIKQSRRASARFWQDPIQFRLAEGRS